MPRGDYGNVAIKQQLLDRVDRYVAANNDGITNRSEAIHAAIREFLDRRELPLLPPEAMEKAVKEYLDRLWEQERGQRQQ